MPTLSRTYLIPTRGTPKFYHTLSHVRTNPFGKTVYIAYCGYHTLYTMETENPRVALNKGLRSCPTCQEKRP